MMKCVLVLALLHLCVSAKSDSNLITEIIRGLESLSKVNFTYNRSVTIKVPAGCSLKMPRNCSGVVIKELKKLLSNVTVHDGSKIQELQGNLNALAHHHNDTNSHSCCVKSAHMSNQTFRLYKNFFKKLNTRV